MYLSTFKILSEYHQSATSEELEECAEIFHMDRENLLSFSDFWGFGSITVKGVPFTPSSRWPHIPVFIWWSNVLYCQQEWWKKPQNELWEVTQQLNTLNKTLKFCGLNFFQSFISYYSWNMELLKISCCSKFHYRNEQKEKWKWRQMLKILHNTGLNPAALPRLHRLRQSQTENAGSNV